MTLYCEFLFCLFVPGSNRFTSAVKLHTFKPTYQINICMCVCRLRLQNVAVHFINGDSSLTGFYFKKMYGRFAGTKTVAVITR